MRFVSYALGASLCAWSGVALAQQTVGTWTLSHVRRTRSPDNATCNWSFAIEASEIQNERPPANCTFEVRGTAELDCDKQHDLGDVPCTDGVTQYTIGGGWSDQGFVVLSVVNPDENAQAYFGYSDHALNSGADLPAQDKKAIKLGSVDVDDAAASREKRDGQPNALLLLEDATAWKVSNLQRSVEQGPRSIIVNFIIEAENAQGVLCSLNISGPPNADLATWSWYDHRCKGSEWTVSMGYIADVDAGIMTVVSPSGHREAYFGVRGINQATKLGSIGPNSVSDF